MSFLISNIYKYYFLNDYKMLRIISFVVNKHLKYADT